MIKIKRHHQITKWSTHGMVSSRNGTLSFQSKCFGLDGTMNAKYAMIRSLLFIPGNSAKMLSKVFTTCADAVVPDLEDSVPQDGKLEARDIVSSFLRNEWKNLRMDQQAQQKNVQTNQILFKPFMIPRVNATNDLLYDDLDALLSCGTLDGMKNLVDAVTVGKTSSASDVFEIDRMLSEIEKKYQIPDKSVKLIPTIETCLGLIHSFEICSMGSKCQRLIGVAFGADDYATDLGFTRPKNTPVEKELEFARNTIAVSARAANIASFDTPNVNFKDSDGLLNECNAVKQMGFKGKFAIHPNQVETINQIFGFSEEEILHARKVVEAYEKAVQDHKRGSTQVDGRMVDQPVYNRYKNVLALYDMYLKRS